jgi:hypothetical protein
MSDAPLFVEAARQQGYAPEAATAALEAVAARLGDGARQRRFFCFRSPGGMGGGGAAPPAGRPRTLLLFRSADDALSFAQARGLGAAPQLMALRLDAALAVLLQRPAIGVLLVAAGDAGRGGGLPPGARLERAELLGLLAAQRP